MKFTNFAVILKRRKQSTCNFNTMFSMLLPTFAAKIMEIGKFFRKLRHLPCWQNAHSAFPNILCTCAAAHGIITAKIEGSHTEPCWFLTAMVSVDKNQKCIDTETLTGSGALFATQPIKEWRK